MDTALSPVFFPQLEQEKEAIETEIGCTLDWNNAVTLKQWRIGMRKEGVSVSNRQDWTAQYDWMIDRLVQFDSVFRDRIQKLSSEPPPIGAVDKS